MNTFEQNKGNEQSATFEREAKIDLASIRSAVERINSLDEVRNLKRIKSYLEALDLDELEKAWTRTEAARDRTS